MKHPHLKTQRSRFYSRYINETSSISRCVSFFDHKDARDAKQGVIFLENGIFPDSHSHARSTIEAAIGGTVNCAIVCMTLQYVVLNDKMILLSSVWGRRVVRNPQYGN